MKKRLNIFCLFMTPILIIALGFCIKNHRIFVSILDKPTTMSYSKNNVNSNTNTKNVLSNHYIIEKDKKSKSKDYTDDLLKINPTFVKDNQNIMVYPGGQPIGDRKSVV